MLNFQQTQKQTLKISPSQIQLLNFFQLNSLELEQFIKNQLEENPILEEGTETNKEFDEDDYEIRSNLTNDKTQDYMDWDEFNDDNQPDYKTRINNFSDHEGVFTPLLIENITWRDEIKEQLHLLVNTERKALLVDYIIDSLSDEGYLRSSLESLTDDVSFMSGLYIEETEIYEIIELLQKIDPVGLGAKNIQECLTLQLEKQKDDISKAALLILNDFFEEISTRNYEKILRETKLDSNELKEIIRKISSLKPHPIMGDQTINPYFIKDNIIPDYIITVEGDWLDVSLNTKGIPPLHINKEYANNLDKSRAANTYINSKINAANWLIDAIQQRENTMLKTIKAIVKFQKDFFITGDFKNLKPMVLNDIATTITMDISTVSRVTSGKYAQTPFGVLHIKELFTEAIKSESGIEVSNRQIQNILSEIIENEDKRNPLNDFQLATLLAQKGYPIARRTIAKYRDNLGIMPATLRRIL